MIQYEFLTGVPVVGDVVSDGVLIPFGNLPHLSEAELAGYGLRRVTLPDPEPEPARIRLPKLTLVDRLDKAGKLADAIAALGTDTVQRIRWDASSAVDPNNPDVRALLTVIVGPDQVDAFLAPETPEEAAL